MTRNRFMAGSGEVDITPDLGTALAGEFGPHTAESVKSPLFVRAQVFEEPEQRLVILSLDLFGLDPACAEEMTRAVAQKAGVSTAAVMLVSSRTRGAPYTVEGVGGDSLDTAYLNTVQAAALRAVEQALHQMQPAAVGVGHVTVPHLVYNHRLMTRNMKAVSGWLNVPKNEVLAPEGPVDSQLSVVVIRDRQGFLASLLWSFAAENRFEEPGVVSSGLPGAVQSEIDARLGRHIPVLYLPGCGSNISYVHDLDRSADGVASAVMAAYLETSGDPDVRLACVEEPVILPVRDTQEFWAREDIRLKHPDVEDVYAREVDLLRQAGERAVRSRIQAFRVGRYAIVGMPGAPFTELGKAVKEASPAAETIVVGNTGGALGYLMPREALAAEGQETWPSRVNKIGPGAAEFVAEQAVSLVRSLWRC